MIIASCLQKHSSSTGAVLFLLSITARIGETACCGGICELEDLRRLPELSLELQGLTVVGAQRILPGGLPWGNLHLSSQSHPGCSGSASQLLWTQRLQWLPGPSSTVTSPGTLPWSVGPFFRSELKVASGFLDNCFEGLLDPPNIIWAYAKNCRPDFSSAMVFAG